MTNLNEHLKRISGPLVLEANIIHSHVHTCSKTMNLKRYTLTTGKISIILIQ